MKPLNFPVLTAILSLSVLSTFKAFGATQNHKAHVHGIAKLTLAIETPTSANIDLDVPGDSIYGFEHKARSAEDQKAQAAGFKKLRDSAPNVIKFDPALGCVVTTTKVEIEKEAAGESEAEPSGSGSSEHHGEHSDVNASYSVQCKKPLPGSQIKIGLIQLFSKIHAVSLQILTTSGQIEKKVQDANEVTVIPSAT